MILCRLPFLLKAQEGESILSYSYLNIVSVNDTETFYFFYPHSRIILLFLHSDKIITAHKTKPTTNG